MQHTFDLSGGHPALDLVNTLSGRLNPSPREDLRDYADLLAWSEASGLLTAAEADALRSEAAAHPAAAQAALAQARALREALFGLFSASLDERAPDPADQATLNDALGAALSQLELVPRNGGFDWAWRLESLHLRRPIWAVARAAAELLTSDDLDRVRLCAESHCAWLFYDSSRNRSRQWCDMKICGNRVKARRHYARVKAAGA
jgi:predicted RNA-binding Zn ribbon-like protein